MGRNIPWGKTLIVLLALLLSNPAYSEPIVGQHHNQDWKQKNSVENIFLPGKNPYKYVKVHSFKNIKEEIIKSQYKKASNKAWDKYLQTTYSRLLPYRDFIVNEIEKQDAPPELLYLPIVESGARPMARSHRGATGMWQFMANSSRAYDMRTTEWLDERRDFAKSTRGAISKLKYNYKVTGDWLLALAAYNCGLGRVQRVIKKTGIRDFWELSEKRLLPRETIDYVPKFLLVSHLLQNKNSYSVPIKWEQNMWEEIPLKQAVDLRMLSSKAEVPFNILKLGNSELNYNVTPPTYSNYKLKVPVKYTDSIMGALKNQDNLVEFYRYKVKSGDTLSEIGYHYGLSATGIIKYNPGVTARSLRVGKTLIIPAIKKVKTYAKFKSSGPFKNDYIVKAGDTLWDISVEYSTTPEEIAINSGINVNGYLKEGMILKVP